MSTEQQGFRVAATLAAALIRQQSHPTPESAAEAFYKVVAELQRQMPADDKKCQMLFSG